MSDDTNRRLELADRDHTWRVHYFAMLAKEAVFMAQDLLNDVADRETQTALSDALAEARGLLEAIDRTVHYDDGSRARTVDAKEFLARRFKDRMGW